MKIIAVISKHPGSGQITVEVNLACGLARQGYRVLIGYLGQSKKLTDWLGVKQKQNRAPDSQPAEDNNGADILSSELRIDLLNMMARAENCLESPVNLPALDKLDYDYLFLHSESSADFKKMKIKADVVIACTDLSHDNELQEFQALEECLHISTGKANSIDFILPNKINTKEWQHNSEQLFALSDYFGYEKICDPVPG